jgi:molecular chaperone DnaJ
MSKRDCYEVLEVSREASDDEIKRAYKKLAKVYHPDVNKDRGAEDRFKEVTEAYEILSNDKKRAHYNQHGYNSRSGPTAEDIFSHHMRSRRAHSKQGSDVQVNIEISLEEAMFGSVRRVDYRKLDLCETCKGNGSEKPDKVEICIHCNGQGVINIQRNSIDGRMQFSQMSPCNNCRGQGVKFQNPCKPCSSNGVVEKQKTLNVTIPRGVNSGNHLKMPGLGSSGTNGVGNLYVTIYVKSDERFKRQDDQLYTEVEASFPDMVLGGTIEVPIMHNSSNKGPKQTRSLEVPAGTKPGDVLIIPNEGMPNVNNPEKRGHLHVGVLVKVPKNPSDREIEAINNYKAVLNEQSKED